MSNALDDLLRNLASLEFEVLHQEDDQAVIRAREYGATFVLTAAGDWIQVSQALLDGDEIEDQVRPMAADLALRIQGRFLGCRFAWDEDGALSALLDLFPGTPIEVVTRALAQLSYVASATLPLFGELGDGMVEEERIELALGETSE